jgi:hypothetical protein
MNNKRLAVISVVGIFLVGVITVLIGRSDFYRQTSSALRPPTEATTKPEPTPTPSGKVVSAFYKDLIKDVEVLTVQNDSSSSVRTFRISGKARGTWFFEGSFPIELQDENGKAITTVVATAESEWMTSDFVTFTATINYTFQATKTGFILLMKDNPSGEPANDDEFKIPVSFETTL